MRILVKNGYVVTVNDRRDVFDGGYVLVQDGRIEKIGRQPDPKLLYDEVIDAAGCLVLPGLINMHQHHWYSLFKGVADGILLEDWLHQIVFPITAHLSANAMRHASYLCGMDMLATGTTCSLNHSVTVTTPEITAASIEPQVELGLRQVFAKELRCRTPLFASHPLTLEESLAEFEQEFARWNGARDGLVRMAMVIEANAHWTASGMSTEELIVRGYELARKHRLRISSHISGGTFSLEKGLLKHLRETGRTDVRYLMMLGVLDESWILAHGIHCTDLDLEQMATVGASLVHTPTSETIRGGGIGPIAVANSKGVNTALGTDGAMVDYSNDMVEQIRVATLLQHARHLDPTRLPVEQAIEMATIRAARALGLDHELGSLEAGKRADIAVFDMRKVHIGVLHRPLSTFFSAGRGSDAKLVMVDGRICFRDGRFMCGADPSAIVREAEKVATEILKKAGLASRLVPAWRTRGESEVATRRAAGGHA
ncbi:MAG: amidohydrolase family protein [Proteobacteria bacterium]|nr:amidohydrolase family protein [Pseudomonadota bacterium]